VEAKNLMQTGKNFVKYSHLNLPPFLCPQNCSALFVGRAIGLSFAAPPTFYCGLPICERKSVEKTPLPRPMQIHKKLLCSLTIDKAKIANVIQHTRSCLSIYWAAICFYYINQPRTLHIAFNKCFYNCDVVFEKSLYITFLIKKKFAFQVHA